jgi:hypothetical protein
MGEARALGVWKHGVPESTGAIPFFREDFLQSTFFHLLPDSISSAIGSVYVQPGQLFTLSMVHL